MNNFINKFKVFVTENRFSYTDIVIISILSEIVKYFIF